MRDGTIRGGSTFVMFEFVHTPRQDSRATEEWERFWLPRKRWKVPDYCTPDIAIGREGIISVQYSPSKEAWSNECTC